MIMNDKQVVDMLLVKESEIISKFHVAINEILRLGYESERGKNQVHQLIESVKYSLDDIERIISR